GGGGGGGPRHSRRPIRTALTGQATPTTTISTASHRHRFPTGSLWPCPDGPARASRLWPGSDPVGDGVGGVIWMLVKPPPARPARYSAKAGSPGDAPDIIPAFGSQVGRVERRVENR